MREEAAKRRASKAHADDEDLHIHYELPPFRLEVMPSGASDSLDWAANELEKSMTWLGGHTWNPLRVWEASTVRLSALLEEGIRGLERFVATAEGMLQGQDWQHHATDHTLRARFEFRVNTMQWHLDTLRYQSAERAWQLNNYRMRTAMAGFGHTNATGKEAAAK